MEVTLRAETGRRPGSRPSRRLRRAGRVPAVLYGKEIDPTPISVDRRDLYAVLHTEAGLNALINLEIEGAGPTLTMAKVLERHPVLGEITHVDFVTISLTEKTTVEVALDLQGVPTGVRDGGIVETVGATVTVEALPTDIPAAIAVDISHVGVGDTLRVADLPALAGVEYLNDPDEPLVIVALPAVAMAEEEVEEEAAEEEGVEAEEPAEEAESE